MVYDIREAGVFIPGIVKYDELTEQQKDELWDKGVLGTPPPNWERDEPWNPNNPERTPAWHEIKQDTRELIDQIQKLTSDQALSVMQELTKRAMPAKQAREKQEEYIQGIDEEILKHLKKPMTKHGLLSTGVPEEHTPEVVSRLLALVRAGKVKTKRVYQKGSGYEYYYQAVQPAE